MVTFDILGETGAKIRCVYNGDDENVRKNFSPLLLSSVGCGYVDVIIDNIEIEVAGIKYCIYDEMGALTNESYKHVFKNLIITHHSTPDDIMSTPRCIGGGLGNNGLNIVEGCLFSSEIKCSIDYHGAFDGGAESSKIIINNCYAPTNTVSGTTLSLKSNPTLMIVCNCMLGYEPEQNDYNGSSDVVVKSFNIQLSN